MNQAPAQRRPSRLRALTIGLLGLVGGLLPAAEPLVFVSGYGPEIISYTLDGSGKMTEVGRAPGGANPSFLAWSPDHKNLYAVNEGSGGGKVLSFAIDATGKLTKTGEGSMGAAGSACHLSVHPSGKWIFTASYGSGHVTVLPIKADGSVGDAVDVQMAGKNAHQTVVNKDGSVLFVPTLGIDQVQVYAVDAVAGKLTQTTSIPLAKGAGPRHCALSHDEKYLYVINEYGSSVTTFINEGGKRQFKDVGTVPTLPADFTGKNTCAHIVVAPDGKTIYGSNRGHNSVAIFRVSDDGAKLTVAGHETAGGEINTPRNFSLSPDGSLALVASQKGDVVSVLKVDPATGLMTKVGSQKVGPGPSFVGVMPR
ncbi:MAG: lactonase family protein [Planctomycetes bacterium]|nr:lactonase family protein [Planctomycetota bacterium]